MTNSNQKITFSKSQSSIPCSWVGQESSIAFDDAGIAECLKSEVLPCYVVKKGESIGITSNGSLEKSGEGLEVCSIIPGFSSAQLGDPTFCVFHETKYPYFGGSMANGISSEEMVIALGKEGIMASFGAGGLVPSRIEAAIHKIQSELPKGPYCFNLIHSPSEPALERNAVDLFLKNGVTTIEASAFLDLTINVVYYRVAGLSKKSDGSVEIKNRIVAKISRREVASKFMEPAPERFLKTLLESRLITDEQAELARQIPMADDVTVEADSGGHTDNRPLVNLLPSIIALRNEIQKTRNYGVNIRIGAGGGIGTPESALAAFMMGAAYIVTGSVNQACIEAGTSDHVKKILAQVGMADVMMAPASDMFEMGVKLQGLKRGTLFPMRAQKLYEIYLAYNSIDEIPVTEREKLEKQIFKKPLLEIWNETVTFFQERDPDQIKKAEENPKKKMALIFRWYLGLSSHWANSGEKGREMDYQIWCGPAMGAFNDWARNSRYEEAENRKVVEVANHLMSGAAYLYRVQALRLQGINLPSSCSNYILPA